MVSKSLTFISFQLRKQNELFWFSLSITFAIVYGLLGIREGFSHDWIVQDDARQHVFWMLRYLDPELFANDLIADYFQSVAPIGYASLYRLAAALGINPLVFNKFLPPIIGIACTYYCFYFCQRIFPVPFTCFLSSLIFNQIIWMKDDIISATPRAFAYPLLLAFLYYLSKRSLFPCLIIIALFGAFYPQGIFLCAGMLILQLFHWQGLRLRFSPNFDDYYFCVMGLGVAVAVLSPYALHLSEFAPVISVEQAKQLPEFYLKGRSAFFKDNWYDFYIGGGRSGMIPNSIWTPATTIFSLLLPILLRFRQRFPLLNKIQSDINLLPQLMVTSVFMFAMAHLFLFRLHLPSRYTSYSLRIIVAVAAGISLSIITDALVNKLQTNIAANTRNFKLIGQKMAASLGLMAIASTLLGYPSFVDSFPVTKYKTGAIPSLYQFLQQQPKDTLIASLIADADNIPTFAQRSILASREYAIPYHWGYYQPFRQRVIDLIANQYTSDPNQLRRFIRRYGIDLWIVENSSFTPEYVDNNRWFKQHQPVTQEAVDSLRQGKTPFLLAYQDSCKVFEHDQFTVIATECLLDKAK